MRRKHVPQRTCVACRRVRPKRELVRVVRAPDGAIQIDETGKAHGRGAYLCRDRACWEKGVGQPRHSANSPLAYALKSALSETDRVVLMGFAQQLPVGEPRGISHVES